MTFHVLGFHHLHKRKRIYKKHEPMPAKTKFKRFLDKMIYVIAILGPAAVLPQLMKIWLGKVVDGVAIETWSIALVISFFWLAYGLVHKEKPIIIAQFLYIILHVSVISGIIMYS